MSKRKTIGFGFDPDECLQHFLLVIPKDKEHDVAVYERFIWDDMIFQESELPGDNNNQLHQKIRINRIKWDMVRPTVENYLNTILKETDRVACRFKNGQNPIERLLGKELMVLLWAIEDCDPSVIPNAIRNWQGFSREERWWLFTMTNAVTGNADDKRGWRIALRYAITDNPIREKNNYLFESLFQNNG